MYIAYTTLWSEGVVVARKDDTKFAIGYDAINGGTYYVPTLEEALKTGEIVAESDDVKEIVKYDSALYTRYGVDSEEVAMYHDLRRMRVNRGSIY